MMKILTILFVALIAFGCNVTDKDDVLPITADMIDAEFPAVMSFKSLEHDFGDVAFGQKLNFSFEFQNTGESPLVIHSVKPSCHCTVMKDWPREPVRPGETGIITAQFEGKFTGTNNKYISIMANTAPTNTTLFLTANVVGGN